MGVDYRALEIYLNDHAEPLGLVSMQTSPVANLVSELFPGRIRALFSAEHGYFGTAAAGEKTVSAWHPDYNVPIHSLYGETRSPTDEMMEGVGRVLIDLRDLGCRCYTFLATIRNVVRACAVRGIPVTVLDVPIPLGGIVDGPMRGDAYESFVAPLNVPLCHGMTPGECALWIRAQEGLKVDIDVVKASDWTHSTRDPWLNFFPPSPAIKAIDNAILYPMTVFTEAYPALDCDRAGPMAFRVIAAPWMNPRQVMGDLRRALTACGVGMRPYRYQPQSGNYQGLHLNGVMFSVLYPGAFSPVTAGVILLSLLMKTYGEKVSLGSRPEWMDKLYGSPETRRAVEACDLSPLVQSWISQHDAYRETRVDLYG